MPEHNLVVRVGDCTFHAECSCGEKLRPWSIRINQSLDLFQRDWERHTMEVGLT